MKDLPDIIQLIKMNAINPNSKDIKDLFEEYNLLELYERVKEAAGY